MESAKRLIRRSILAQSIHELWGEGTTLEQLHKHVKDTSQERWPLFKDASFKFEVEPFRGTRSLKSRLAIIKSFAYLPFDGPISMSNPDQTFGVFELWPHNSVTLGIESPERVYLGRHIQNSAREMIHRYDLKKRGYISTTSMDSELSLVTANMALAAPGRLIYDPFVGTGSFPVACAHFGAMTWGSDIDGLSMRGQGGKKSLKGNFEQYEFRNRLGDVFAADLTNTPIRKGRIWDGLVCDPPYGVREGLKVLGLRDTGKSSSFNLWSKENYKYDINHLTVWTIITNRPFLILPTRTPTYVPPKRPYSFLAMLDDLLIFAAEILVDNGRLCFWMPTANDADQQIAIPEHPCLEIVSVCVQTFYKCKPRWELSPEAFRLTKCAGSRRLITYRRLPDDVVSTEALDAYRARQVSDTNQGKTANDLNPFRKGYFNKFSTEQ